VPEPGEPGSDTWEGESWKSVVASVDYRSVRRRDEYHVWTTGNPSPSNRGEGRAGDNLYSNSLLALDPEPEN